MAFNFDVEAMDQAGGLTVVWDKQEGKLTIEAGIQDVEGICWGKYKDTISKNGWSHLQIHLSENPNFNNDVKMYSAGWLEGILTAVRLSQYFANQHSVLLRAEGTWGSIGNIKTEFAKALKFMKKKS